jgi:N-acetylmuramoyl-L-alanine amidase
MNRKITAAIVLIIFVSLSSFVLAAEKPIEIYINEVEVDSDVPPVILNGRTLVPIRVISENLGAKVHWDNKNRTVKVIADSINVLLKIDSKKASVNNQEVLLDVPAKIIKDRTMIPLRFVGEALGADVEWNNDRRCVVINKTDNGNDVNSNVNISDLSYEVINDRPSIVIKGDGALKYEQEKSTDWSKLVIDIYADNNLKNNAIYVDSDIVRKAVIGTFKTDPLISRIVVELKQDVPYQIYQTDSEKNIIISFNTLNNTAKNTLKNITIEDKGSEISVNLKTSKSSDINYFLLSNPDRFVVDINDTVIDVVAPKVSTNRYFEDLRVGQFSNDPDVVRVVFDLKKGVRYKLHKEDNEIKILFSEVSNEGKLIVIDPGHGGSDPGTVAGMAYEKDFNLDIAIRLKKLLEDKNINVLMTREDDVYVGTYARPIMANEAGADLFISIHNNSCGNPSVSGTETLCYPDPKKRAFALEIQKAVVKELGLPDRGLVEKPGYIVTREAKMPAALVEVAFMSNSNDLSLLKTEEFRQKAAQGIFNGIMNYLN